MLLGECELDIAIAQDYRGLCYHGYQTVGSFMVEGSRCVCVCVCACVCPHAWHSQRKSAQVYTPVIPTHALCRGIQYV